MSALRKQAKTAYQIRNMIGIYNTVHLKNYKWVPVEDAEAEIEKLRSELGETKEVLEHAEDESKFLLKMVKELEGRIADALKIAVDGFDEATHLNYCDAIWTFTALLEKLGCHVSKDKFGDPELRPEDRRKIEERLTVKNK